MVPEPVIAIFGGPAGAGKSTLARRWGDQFPPAVNIEHDAIGNLIRSGKADFQSGTPLVAAQVKAVSRACSVIAKSFFSSGFNVAIDHVFYPGEFENDWEPYLEGCRCAFVIIRPDLATTLERGSSRPKQVREDIVRHQHAETGKWPSSFIVDTTGLSVDESLERVAAVIAQTTRTIGTQSLT
jgi:predicted kinase